MRTHDGRVRNQHGNRTHESHRNLVECKGRNQSERHIMIKELVFDDAILSTPCEAATAEDASVAQDLIDTLASIEGAACLAANQIGVTKALCVYLDESDKPHAIYNPKIMLGLAAFKTEEGCLTRPEDQLSKVTRYDHMKLAFDELVNGELKHRKRDFAGWEAQMIQHMVDHCKGKLV